jgi:hypothetical protein
MEYVMEYVRPCYWPKIYGQYANVTTGDIHLRVPKLGWLVQLENNHNQQKTCLLWTNYQRLTTFIHMHQNLSICLEVFLEISMLQKKSEGAYQTNENSVETCDWNVEIPSGNLTICY